MELWLPIAQTAVVVMVIVQILLTVTVSAIRAMLVVIAPNEYVLPLARG